MGIIVGSRRLNPNHLQKALRSIHRSCLVHIGLVSPKGFYYLVPYFEDWVHSVHGTLKNYRDILPANLPHLILGKRNKICPVKDYLAFSDYSSRGKNLQKRKGDCSLSTS